MTLSRATRPWSIALVVLLVVLAVLEGNQRHVQAQELSPHLIIIKKAVGGDATFNFTISGSTSTSTSLTTVGGWAASSPIELNVGSSTVVEEVKSGWDFTDSTCFNGEDSIGVSADGGDEISVGMGDNVTCGFINTKENGGGEVGESNGATAGSLAISGGGVGNGPIVGSLGGSASGLAGSPQANSGQGGAGVYTGQVLGASTQGCSAYLTTYMRRGEANDPAEVRKLQAFLNTIMGSGLPIDGIFGLSTEQAVNAFQLKYTSDVLAPWGIVEPTGYVYLTTQKKINELYCGLAKQFPLTPDQLQIIEQSRSGKYSEGVNDSSAVVMNDSGGGGAPPIDTSGGNPATTSAPRGISNYGWLIIVLLITLGLGWWGWQRYVEPQADS